ncbi:MAG: hypothetical protein GKS00_21960 [Alphaproteobacteria bacterium]|nr:hypothetical protein [Alphaproteobacteria bacterium]
MTDETAALEGSEDNAPIEDGAPPDWRASIEDPDLYRLSERYESATAMAKAVSDLRRETATRIKPLGESPTPDEIAAYRKQTGVPLSADGYAFDMPQGTEPSEADTAFQNEMARAMHGVNVTGGQAKALGSAFNDYVARQQADTEAVSAAALEQSVAALKREFGADYDRNVEYARRAALDFGSESFVEFLETKIVDGAPLGDHPAFIKAFARIGRGAGEASIDVETPAGDSATLDERIRAKRTEIQQALDRGDHKRAHQLDREERALWSRVRD